MESRCSFSISNSLKYSFYEGPWTWTVYLALHIILLAVDVELHRIQNPDWSWKRKPQPPKPTTRNTPIFAQTIFCRY